jgi:hypothetical protein
MHHESEPFTVVATMGDVEPPRDGLGLLRVHLPHGSIDQPLSFVFPRGRGVPGISRRHLARRCVVHGASFPTSVDRGRGPLRSALTVPWLTPGESSWRLGGLTPAYSSVSTLVDRDTGRMVSNVHRLCHLGLLRSTEGETRDRRIPVATIRGAVVGPTYQMPEAVGCPSEWAMSTMIQ